MVAQRTVKLFIRLWEFLFTVIIMSLVGNMIAEAFAGNPSSINYDMFVAAFALVTLFYLIAADFDEKFIGIPVLPLALDVLNAIFWFCAAVNMAAQLGCHSCSNKSYTRTNHITNGAHNTDDRCREAQATTAFLWFGWALFMVSLVYSFFYVRGTGVNMRAGRGAPAMSQV